MVGNDAAWHHRGIVAGITINPLMERHVAIIDFAVLRACFK